MLVWDRLLGIRESLGFVPRNLMQIRFCNGDAISDSLSTPNGWASNNNSLFSSFFTFSLVGLKLMKSMVSWPLIACEGATRACSQASIMKQGLRLSSTVWELLSMILELTRSPIFFTKDYLATTGLICLWNYWLKFNIKWQENIKQWSQTSNLQPQVL